MSKFLALQDLSHDPKLAEALGNMVVAWAHAEIMLHCTFSRVTNTGLNMGLESYNRIPTFESRVKFTRALLSEWKTTEFHVAEIDEAVEKLAKLASTRNGWVHGDWCANEDKSQTVIFNHRAPVDSDKRRKPVKAHDVYDHCRAVRERTNALGELIRWQELEA